MGAPRLPNGSTFACPTSMPGQLVSRKPVIGIGARRFDLPSEG
jgi:hypothetical protein